VTTLADNFIIPPAPDTTGDNLDPKGKPKKRDDLLALALLTLPTDEDSALRLWDETMPRAYRGLLTGQGWTWDPQNQDYVSATGTTLDNADLKRLSIMFSTAIETSELEPLAEQMATGAIDIDDWQDQTAAILKELYVAQALLAAGGESNLAPDDIKTLEGSVSSGTGLQFAMDRLANFGTQIDEGDPGVSTVPAIVNRSGFYADTANIVYESIKRASHGRAIDDTGRQLFMFEKNILAPGDNCSDGKFTEGCIEQTEAGWVPLDQLVPIGQRTCSFRCRCSMSYILVPEGNDLPEI
jgi:hypothetical protein